MSSRNASSSSISPSKGTWIQFEEGPEAAKNDDSAAVLDTQPEQVNIEVKCPNVPSSPKGGLLHSKSEPMNGSVSSSSAIKRESASVEFSPLNPANLQNIPLSEPLRSQTNIQREVVRQGFANGDVIVTILPQNASLPWVLPARFRPELVPEELMAQGLTLTVEDYVHVMSQLVNDHRFTLYNICYKRILMAWISLAFVILLCILFLKLPQYGLFGAGIAWLLVNAAAIFVCMWIKIRLNKNLERCLSSINLQLMKHKILLGVDDRGKLSCHKINLCFIYFDPQQCIKKLQQTIEQQRDAEGDKPGPSIDQRYDIEDPEIIITGSTNTRVARQQEKAASLLFAQYSQRWAKEFLRKRLDWAFDASARLVGLSPPVSPRHLSAARCPCQFIEEHLDVKSFRKRNENNCCFACLSDFCRNVDL